MTDESFFEPPAGGSAYTSGPFEPPRGSRRPAWVAIVALALLSAMVGGGVALLLLPYVAPAYYTARVVPPTISTVSTPALRDSPAIAVERAVGPAVVAIVNESVTSNFFTGPQVQQGTGSGVIFDARGYIVTNYHVVAGASRLTVILPDGRRLPAQLVGSDPPTDLAVVKVDAGKPLATAAFADSDKVVTGERAIAIGNPLGLDLTRTVTMGVVSGVRTVLYGYGQEQRDTKLIQTDAAINPGNSGGPLCNSLGLVMGLNTLKVTSTDGGGVPAEGIGFAVPSNTVRRVVDDIVRYGHVRRVYLGVAFNLPPGATQSCSAVPLTVADVYAGTPAALAGVESGDVITSIAGHPLVGFCDLVIQTDRYRPGQTVTLGLKRAGQALTVRVTLEEEPLGGLG